MIYISTIIIYCSCPIILFVYAAVSVRRKTSKGLTTLSASRYSLKTFIVIFCMHHKDIPVYLLQINTFAISTFYVINHFISSSRMSLASSRQSLASSRQSLAGSRHSLAGSVSHLASPAVEKAPENSGLTNDPVPQTPKRASFVEVCTKPAKFQNYISFPVVTFSDWFC